MNKNRVLHFLFFLHNTQMKSYISSSYSKEYDCTRVLTTYRHVKQH